MPTQGADARLLPSGTAIRRSSCSCCTACASTDCVCRPSAPPSTITWRCSRRRPRTPIRDEHQRQGVAQVSVANAITSLRLCATLDWQEYVESVSLVEQVLQRDPAGAYGRMDFLSRDQQRQAVEELAPPTGEAPGARRPEGGRDRAPGRGRAARRPTARRTSAITSSTAGRRDLEADLAYRPRLRRGCVGALLAARRRRSTSARSRSLTALLVARRCAVRPHAGGSPRSPARARRRCSCCCRRATSRRRCVQRAVALWCRRERLPRLDFSSRRARRRPHDGRSCRRC